jgi:hypothetical protein
MKTVIGFSNIYYTLWQISEPYKVYTSPKTWYEKVNVCYIKNLSMDLEEAKSKVPNFDYVNLELKGQYGSRYSEVIKHGNDYTDDQFKTWPLEGQYVKDCNSVYHLFKGLDAETNPRTRVYIRRRLVELGDLIQLKGDRLKLGEKIFGCGKSRFYTKKQVERIIEAENSPISGHYGTNGKREILFLTQVKSFGFDSVYGYQHVVIYKDVENKEYKYKGTSPIYLSDYSMKDGNGSTLKVKATIDHDEYKGVNETRLKRMQLVKP